MLVYDNVSHVPPWLSDLLAQVATGAGFGGRKLYTDGEEVSFTAARPVLLNGIASEMIDRPDLLVRALVVELPVAPDGARRTEAEVWAALGAARPPVLGALLDVVSAGLRDLGKVRLERSPRMADFVHWVEACSGALGWRPGEFARQLLDLRGELDDEALGLWPVWPVLRLLLLRGKKFEGTMTELLRALNDERVHDYLSTPEWPRTPKMLGVQLKRYAPGMRRNGVLVEKLPRSSAGHRLRIILAPAAVPGTGAA